MPAATAAAEPPEDPPGTLSKSQGLWVVKKSEFSVEEPCAQASQLFLPMITAPAFLRRDTIVASYGGTKSSNIFEPAVVLISLVQITSLMEIGIPSIWLRRLWLTCPELACGEFIESVEWVAYCLSLSRA